MLLGRTNFLRITDLLPRLETLAESLVKIDFDDLSLFGGYAFFADGRFVFGAERWYALHAEFDWAFQKLAETSVVPVIYDDHRYKFIHQDGRVELRSSRNEETLAAPWTHFHAEATRAMAINSQFKQELADRWRRLLPSQTNEILRCLGLAC